MSHAKTGEPRRDTYRNKGSRERKRRARNRRECVKTPSRKGVKGKTEKRDGENRREYVGEGLRKRREGSRETERKEKEEGRKKKETEWELLCSLIPLGELQALIAAPLDRNCTSQRTACFHIKDAHNVVLCKRHEMAAKGKNLHHGCLVANISPDLGGSG